MRTDIVTKNGSILGKIPRKKSSNLSNNNMPSSSNSSFYPSSYLSSSSSESSRGYIGRSPRATPAMNRVSSIEELTPRRAPRASPAMNRVSSVEEMAPRRLRPDMTEAIAGWRSQAAVPPRAPRMAAWEYGREPAARPARREILLPTPEPAPAASARTRYLTTRRSAGSLALSPPIPPRPRNPADYSSSSDSGSSMRSSSTRSSSRSAGSSSHLTPVTRDFLRASRRSRETSSRSAAAKEENHPEEGESYFPTPKVTFLIDEPRGLRCQICQETPLELAESADDDEHAHPVILPCGHVACEGCMDQWLSAHATCPFCRLDMTHAGCGHAVTPRVLAHDTVPGLPRTTAEGGSIGHKCRDCRVEDLQAQALREWKDLADDVRRARRRAQELGTAEADHALKQALKAFEAAPSRTRDVFTRVESSW